MMNPDALPVAALEEQLRQLDFALDLLDSARRDLLPPAATFWAGQARASYDREVADVGVGIDSAADVIALARHRTLLALAGGDHLG